MGQKYNLTFDQKCQDFMDTERPHPQQQDNVPLFIHSFKD